MQRPSVASTVMVRAGVLPSWRAAYRRLFQSVMRAPLWTCFSCQSLRQAYEDGSCCVPCRSGGLLSGDWGRFDAGHWSHGVAEVEILQILVLELSFGE